MDALTARIRQRYVTALGAGKSVEEATAYANALTDSRPMVDLAPPPASLTAAVTGNPLDHDGDGRKGGSVAAPPSADLPALRAEYAARFGKKPFGGWDAATVRAKIEAANGQ